MGKKGVDWDGAITLDDYVISMIKAKKVKTDEFQLLLKYYGRTRLKAIWEKYLESKKKLK